MNQYDYDVSVADNLNALEYQLSVAVLAKEQAEARYNALFLQVFHEFDQTAGVDAPASFVCDDGFKLARIVPVMSPQVDAGKVLETTTSMGGTRMWNAVTDAVRVVNQDKLAAEIKKYPLLGQMLDEAGAITIPVRSPSRIRKLATKQERMLLENKQTKEDAG